MDHAIFDPVERARAKQASRDQDESDLAEGRLAKDDLRRRNGFIPADSARSAVIREWKEFD